MKKKNYLQHKDHRIINKQLKLFYITKDNPGIIFWNINGYKIILNIQNFLRKKFIENNYLEINTPILMNKKIWEKSGHWKNYKNSIFSTNNKKNKLCIKPMSCPGHIYIYKQNIISYKMMPIRFSEFGICHRNESSGALCGLLRTKSFIQDDAHIFCTNEQIEKEVLKCIDMTYKIYNIFNFKNITIYFSTRPKKYIGNKKKWKTSENILLNILKKKNINFKIKKGEGAFYGPKIEFILKDSFLRKWQCGTIQLDFYLSKKLSAYYIDKDNKKCYPIIIHRAILGSLERFIGILIEENNGWLPLWLTPIQIVVLNVSEKHIKYAKKILHKIKSYDIRVIEDFRNKKINYKIREHTLQKIPYMIICGDKEILSKNINIRESLTKKTKITSIKYFIRKIITKIKNFI